MLKLSEIRTIKQADEQLTKLVAVRNDLDSQIRLVVAKRNKLLGKQKFKFPCGLVAPYSEISLIGNYYIEIGQGYSDDVPKFNEYIFYHPEADGYVRFLSRTAQIQYEIPCYEKDHYGKKKWFQNSQPGSYKRKFKEFVTTIEGKIESTGVLHPAYAKWTAHNL